jgi:hypothetical protein
MRRQLGAGLLAALLLLAACGDDDSDAGLRSSAGGTVTTLGSRAGTTDPTAATGAAGGTHATATTTGGTAGGTPTSSPPPPATTVTPGAVGLLGPVLLQPGNGGRIVVEVRAQDGAPPVQGTIDHVASVLRDASGKTVTIEGIGRLGGGAQAWTPSSIAAAADSVAHHAQGGAQVVVRLLFVHGTFEGDDSVLGVSVRGDVAAVFSDQVDAAAGILVSPRVVEDAVTVHEVGHLLGLVDLVLHTGRADPAHPGHSTNRHSVMYWAVESDVISQLLDGGIPNQLDAQDKADLATIRARR